jgi:peptidoglycan hydrolase-like protein with peptidoglycan-binding domain
MKPAESFVCQPVRSLQTMLRVLAEDDGELPTLVPDGIYGAQTRQAVTAFQRKFGIPVTGVADQSTWERIVAEHAPAMIRLGPAEPLRLILNPKQVIRRGESHPYLFLVQGMLTTLAEIYGSLLVPRISGILDESTAQSISSFQYLSALPQTGELDKITWKHLALQYPLAVNIQQSQNRTRR